LDFDFSEDERLFQAQARKALDAACPLTEVRRVLGGETPHSGAAWDTLKALAMPAAAIPEEYGGLGLGYYALCVAAEEVGRALAPTPLSGSIYLAAEALLRAAGEAQKQAWLPALARGEITAAFADTSLDANTVGFDGACLTGRAGPVYDASGASIAIVAAKERQGVSLVLLRLDLPGVSRRRLSTVDPTRDVCELILDGVPAERIGRSGEGAEILQSVLNTAAVLTAFEQIGGAEHALEMARDYALTRRTFGRQIGSYQAIKHKLANVYIKIELARAHAYYGAWALSTGAADLPLAAACARVSATEAFSFAAQENIQTHGGIGFTWESDCQLFYRRARFLALQLGGMLTWTERITSELVGGNSGGFSRGF